MNLRIVASGPIEKQTLTADDHGIHYNESAAFGLGTQYHHAFGEIDAILRTTANPALPVLSIQVGAKIYSIRYKAGDEQHRALVDFIVRKAAETKEPS